MLLLGNALYDLLLPFNLEKIWITEKPLLVSVLCLTPNSHDIITGVATFNIFLSWVQHGLISWDQKIKIEATVQAVALHGDTAAARKLSGKAGPRLRGESLGMFPLLPDRTFSAYGFMPSFSSFFWESQNPEQNLRETETNKLDLFVSHLLLVLFSLPVKILYLLHQEISADKSIHLPLA